MTALAVLGGALFAAQAVQSPDAMAVSGDSARGALPALAPAPGTTWITGTVTDQAAHGQDNVNVEALPVGGGTPAASALTYGGANYNAVAAHGFFRLEVPSDQAYTITFSSVGGAEDGDPFRMRQYGSGRAVMVKTPSTVAAGRIRDLGTIQLARQGKVVSKIKAVVKPAGKKGAKKLQVGERGKLHVTVTSRYVTNVKGRVVVKVDGKKLKGRLSAADHGKLTMKLPKFSKPGKERVVAKFVGTNTVKSSKSKPVKVKVGKK